MAYEAMFATMVIMYNELEEEDSTRKLGRAHH
jgi:hypothetical protein